MARRGIQFLLLNGVEVAGSPSCGWVFTVDKVTYHFAESGTLQTQGDGEQVRIATLDSLPVAVGYILGMHAALEWGEVSIPVVETPK